MGQPFPGIWLPREMNIHAGVTMAMGSLEAAYARRFSDYKQADVKSLIRIPKAPDAAATPRRRETPTTSEPSGPFRSGARLVRRATRRPKSSPRSAFTATPTCAMTRSSGSRASRSDSRCPPTGCATSNSGSRPAATSTSVEVRKRYRSLDSTTDIALILLVHERPGFTSETIDERPSALGWARRRAG